MQKLKSPSDITDHYVFILTLMLLTIYYSSCQTYVSEWIWNTTLFTYLHNNPHKKLRIVLNRDTSQLSLDLDDPLKLNCVVLQLPSVSFPTLRWQDFEITIRKNNIRNDLHRILLANSIHDLYLHFNIFFFIWMLCERILCRIYFHLGREIALIWQSRTVQSREAKIYKNNINC